MTTEPAPDRYGDAVRARRTELRAEQGGLSGTHRAELRAELTLARIVAADAIGAVFADLVRQAGALTAHPGPAAHRALLVAWPAALAEAADRVHEAVLAPLAPALVRIAAVRQLEVDPRPLVGSAPRRPLVVGPPPAPTRAPRFTGAAEGLAVWRVALVGLAATPLVGLPVLGGPALAPVAVGLGAAAAAVVVRFRRHGVARAALQRQVEVLVAQGRAAVRVDVERMLVEWERVVTAALDAAVERRRLLVAAELAGLAAPRAVARV